MRYHGMRIVWDYLPCRTCRVSYLSHPGEGTASSHQYEPIPESIEGMASRKSDVNR